MDSGFEAGIADLCRVDWEGAERGREIRQDMVVVGGEGRG